MIRLGKLLVPAAVLVVLGFSLASCGTDHAQVRYVHGSPDALNLDVAVDGKTVVTDLAFGTVSPASGYLTLSAGSRRVEMRDTGTTTDEINSTISFASGKAYTLIASGLQASIAGVLLTDDHSAPSSGNAKLRVVHVAPDLSLRLDIYIVPAGTDITGMSPTVTGLAFTQATLYQTIAAESTEVIVTETTDQVPIIDQTFDLTSGQNRTLVLLDNAGGSPVTSLVEMADLN